VELLSKSEALYPGGALAQPAGEAEGSAAEEGQLCLDLGPWTLGQGKMNKKDQKIVRHDMQPKKGKAVR
jgi:hypothetical protein